MVVAGVVRGKAGWVEAEKEERCDEGARAGIVEEMGGDCKANSNQMCEKTVEVAK